jgi:hypothetical protein
MLEFPRVAIVSTMREECTADARFFTIEGLELCGPVSVLFWRSQADDGHQTWGGRFKVDSLAVQPRGSLLERQIEIRLEGSGSTGRCMVTRIFGEEVTFKGAGRVPKDLFTHST